MNDVVVLLCLSVYYFTKTLQIYSLFFYPQYL